MVVKDTSPRLLLLIVCFAWSSWMDYQGLWTQVPIFVHVLPEGWTLPSYLTVFVQCANFIALIYTSVNKCCPGDLQRREVIMVYVIMGTGLAALTLLVFFWDNTAWLAGAERSLALLVLSMFLAIVDTTSCVVYLPYMSRFSESYMPAYIAGEDVGGLLTGIAGLLQGVGGEASCYNHTEWLYNDTSATNYSQTTVQVKHEEPLFSVSVFMVFLAMLMLVSIISFSLLNFSSFSKSHMITKSRPAKSDDIFVDKTIGYLYQVSQDEACTAHTSPESLSTSSLVLCVCMFGWGSALMYGLVPSFSSYSLLPYGSLAYTLALRISFICSPLAAISALLLPLRSLPGLKGLVGAVTLMTGYLIFLATQSPAPPLLHQPAGAVLAASCYILSFAVYSYTRACAAKLLSRQAGHQGLYLAGASIQAGSLLGGVLGFVLVSILEVFESVPDCTQNVDVM